MTDRYYPRDAAEPNPGQYYTTYRESVDKALEPRVKIGDFPPGYSGKIVNLRTKIYGHHPKEDPATYEDKREEYVPQKATFKPLQKSTERPISAVSGRPGSRLQSAHSNRPRSATSARPTSPRETVPGRVSRPQSAASSAARKYERDRMVCFQAANDQGTQWYAPTEVEKSNPHSKPRTNGRGSGYNHAMTNIQNPDDPIDYTSTSSSVFKGKLRPNGIDLLKAANEKIKRDNDHSRPNTVSPPAAEERILARSNTMRPESPKKDTRTAHFAAEPDVMSDGRSSLGQDTGAPPKRTIIGHYKTPRYG